MWIFFGGSLRNGNLFWNTFHGRCRDFFRPSSSAFRAFAFVASFLRVISIQISLNLIAFVYSQLLYLEPGQDNRGYRCWGPQQILQGRDENWKGNWMISRMKISRCNWIKFSPKHGIRSREMVFGCHKVWDSRTSYSKHAWWCNGSPP